MLFGGGRGVIEMSGGVEMGDRLMYLKMRVVVKGALLGFGEVGSSRLVIDL